MHDRIRCFFSAGHVDHSALLLLAPRFAACHSHITPKDLAPHSLLLILTAVRRERMRNAFENFFFRVVLKFM